MIFADSSCYKNATKIYYPRIYDKRIKSGEEGYPTRQDTSPVASKIRNGYVVLDEFQTTTENECTIFKPSKCPMGFTLTVWALLFEPPEENKEIYLIYVNHADEFVSIHITNSSAKEMLVKIEVNDGEFLREARFMQTFSVEWVNYGIVWDNASGVRALLNGKIIGLFILYF